MLHVCCHLSCFMMFLTLWRHHALYQLSSKPVCYKVKQYSEHKIDESTNNVCIFKTDKKWKSHFVKFSMFLLSTAYEVVIHH